MRRTNVGRVVYNRPTHYFKPADVLRIMRRVRWDLVTGEDLLKFSIDFFTIMRESIIKQLLALYEFNEVPYEIAAQVSRVAELAYQVIAAYLKLIESTVKKFFGFK